MSETQPKPGHSEKSVVTQSKDGARLAEDIAASVVAELAALDVDSDVLRQLDHKTVREWISADLTEALADLAKGKPLEEESR